MVNLDIGCLVFEKIFGQNLGQFTQNYSSQSIQQNEKCINSPENKIYFVFQIKQADLGE